MEDPMLRVLIWTLLCTFLGGFAHADGPPPLIQEPTGPARPASYDDFVSVRGFATLGEAISRERFLWIPPGTWIVDNPIVLSRDEPLYLHGGDRSNTRIVGSDPTRPLFELVRAPLVQIAGVQLEPVAREAPTDARLIVAYNDAPTILEIVDTRLTVGAIELLGPGEFRLQNALIRPRGLVTNPILLDHPEGRLTVLGGDISNQNAEPRVETQSAFHIRVRRGCLCIYGLSIEAAIGPADFRIDSASAHGPHVLTAVRSEGNNGANSGAYRSTMVSVPSSSERIDLVIRSSIGAWGPWATAMVDSSSTAPRAGSGCWATTYAPEPRRWSRAPALNRPLWRSAISPSRIKGSCRCPVRAESVAATSTTTCCES